MVKEGSFRAQVIGLYVLLLLDMAAGLLFEAQSNTFLAIAATGGSIGLYLFTVFIIFTVLTRTFLFKHGLMGLLLREFRWTFWGILGYAIIFIAFRFRRIGIMLDGTLAEDVWDESGYKALWMTNRIAGVGFYALVMYTLHHAAKADMHRSNSDWQARIQSQLLRT